MSGAYKGVKAGASVGRFRLDDARFGMPEAPRLNNPNDAFFGREGSEVLSVGAIERAAYAAIGLPPPEACQGSERLVHQLGTFTIAESEAATVAAVAEALRGSEIRFFDYADYCHAVSNHSSLVSRQRSEKKAEEAYLALPIERTEYRPYPMPTTTDLEEQFLALFSRANHTANLAGYIHYLRQVHPELAAVLERPLPVYFPEEPRITHTYIVGTTGSGKTELMKLFIHSYVTQPKSAAVVVLDPAGDFAKEIRAWPEFNVGSRLIYLKHDLQSGMVPVLNPFELAGTDPLDTSRQGITAKRVAAQELLSAISLILGSEGGEFSINMERLLMPCILTLFDQPGATLLDLQRFMLDKKNADLLEFALTRSHYPELVSFFADEFGEPSFNPTKRSISTKLGSLFATGFFTEMTCGKSTLNLEEALNQRKVIVFDLSKGKLGNNESIAIGRLLLASLQGIAKRRDGVPKEKRVPVHAFVDECHNYLTPSVKEILRESRKYGLHLTLGQQNVGQEMNQEMRRTVTQMTTVKMSGKTEPDQRERVARQIDVPPERIKEVAAGKGRFFVRFGEYPPFKMRASEALLGGRHRMTKQSENALIARQLRSYYRSVDDLRQSHGAAADDADASSYDIFE